MTIGHPYGAYAQAAEAVTPNQQLLMLYDGAANFVKQAKEALIEKDFDERFNLLNRACAIVNGLSECVDHNVNADMAKTLHNYYVSLDQRLIKALYTDDDLGLFDSIINDIKSMRASWAEAIESIEGVESGAAKDADSASLAMEGAAESSEEASSDSQSSKPNPQSGGSFLGSDFSA